MEPITACKFVVSFISTQKEILKLSVEVRCWIVSIINTIIPPIKTPAEFLFPSRQQYIFFLCPLLVQLRVGRSHHQNCSRQVIDIRNTFRYLGVPIDQPTIMFGDNESVVNTAMQPHAKLAKRHNGLAYHKTRSAIASRILHFIHIRGVTNPADVLSKHWDYPSVRPVLCPLLFWRIPQILHLMSRKKKYFSVFTG